MRKFFLLTAIVEILAGIVLFFVADKIPEFNNVSPLTLGFVKMYGVSAFSLGLFALYVWKFFEIKKLHKPFLIIFSIFLLVEHFFHLIFVNFLFYQKLRRGSAIVTNHQICWRTIELH